MIKGRGLQVDVTLRPAIHSHPLTLSSPLERQLALPARDQARQEAAQGAAKRSQSINQSAAAPARGRRRAHNEWYAP